MTLYLVTAPTTEPITTDEAKRHCRVDLNEENTDLDSMVSAAREYAEGYTRRALITQAWVLKLDAFPHDGCPIELPLPPLKEVTAITYLDDAGATQTWSSSAYTVDKPTGPRCERGRVVPKYQELYPKTQAVPGAVSIAFTCGYGDAGAAVPQAIRRAILVRVGELYDIRGEATRGTIVAANPVTSQRLLWPFRSFGVAA